MDASFVCREGFHADGSFREPHLGFWCEACKQSIVVSSSNPKAAPSHCCKQCKHHLHSYLVCDHVWMPEEGEYFCSADCIRKYNADRIAAATQESDSGHVLLCCRLAKRPDGNEQVEVDLLEQSDSSVIDVGTISVNNDEESHIQRIVDLLDSSEAAPDKDRNREPTREEQPASNAGKDVTDGGEHEGDIHAAASQQLSELLVEGERVQMAFKQGTDDQVGLWWGGTIGTRSTTGVPLVCIAFDDGELKLHEETELKVLMQKGKFKKLETEIGLVADMKQSQRALDFCHMKLNKKHLPVGVLLGDGVEKLCSKMVYSAHVVSPSVLKQLNDSGYNNTSLRRGRSRCVCRAPATQLHASVTFVPTVFIPPLACAPQEEEEKADRSFTPWLLHLPSRRHCSVDRSS